MITREEIESLGFTYSVDRSTDEYDAYTYVFARVDKPRNTQNSYLLINPIGTDYFNLRTNLERLSDFDMWTRGFNGPLDDISELFYIFDSFKEANSKI